MRRNVRVGFRIELAVVQAVQYPAVFVVVTVQRAFESVCLPAVLGFPGMPRRDGGDEVRIDNPPFHQIEPLSIVVVAQSVVVKEMFRPIQSGRPQDMFSGNGLMAKIVDGETDARMPHAQVLVYLVEQHRHQGGLPIVAMDDLRVFAALEHEFQSGPAEKGESQDVIVVAVNTPAIKEVIPRLRVDEKTLAPVHEAEPDGRVDSAVVPGNPQVLIRLGQSPYLVVTHAVVLGQDDLDCIAAQFQLPAQSKNHIGKTAHFGHRRQFRRNHHDKHGGNEPRRRRRRLVRPLVLLLCLRFRLCFLERCLPNRFLRNRRQPRNGRFRRPHLLCRKDRRPCFIGGRFGFHRGGRFLRDHQPAGLRGRDRPFNRRRGRRNPGVGRRRPGLDGLGRSGRRRGRDGVGREIGFSRNGAGRDAGRHCQIGTRLGGNRRHLPELARPRRRRCCWCAN